MAEKDNTFQNTVEALFRGMDSFITTKTVVGEAIQAGQISMIEYFVDVTTLYQSMQNHMQLQNEYQKVMAQLYKFKL